MVSGKLTPERVGTKVPLRSWLPEMLFRWTGRRSIHRVTGESMSPALAPDEWIVVDRRAFNAQPPRPGEIVLARHPYRNDTPMVKRIASIHPDGRYDLRGDNADESTDSRSFGSVSRGAILGKVIARTTRPGY